MTETENNKEIKLNPPQVFDGDRTKTTEFINSLQLHFLINKHIFITEEIKKAYALSFMKGGTAGPWAQAEINRMIQNSNTTGNTVSVAPSKKPSEETFEELIKRFKTEFSDEVSKLAAQAKLQNLKQGGKTVDEYISEFRTAAINSGFTEDGPLILLFRQGLNRPIREKMNAQLAQPTQITEWYKFTATLDNLWRADQGSSRYTKTEHSKGGTYTKRSETVSITAMSEQQRNEHIQKKLCFYCHKPGHISRECPNKPTNREWRKPFTPRTSTSSSEPRTISKVQTEDPDEETETIKIQAMFKNLGTEERAELMDKLSEDF